MRLWKRASETLKDWNSVCIASLSKRTDLRIPDFDAAVIKATSHDESYIDYRNAQRVFTWVRTSPNNLRPVVWSITVRIEKTRSWVVALKGLMLMHGVFCCRIPDIQKIGRLPFNLSSFTDGHLNPAKAWGYNVFVRAYYAFLDQKSSLLFMEMQERIVRIKEKTQEQQPIMRELVKLQKMQGLLDMLLQVKPEADGMNLGLILEAMDCIVIEVFDIYSRICNGIARVLLKVCSAGKAEATMALEVLHKATMQGDELSLYFEFCRENGVLSASECPKVDRVPEEDIRELERIINGSVSMKSCSEGKLVPEDQEKTEAAVRESNIHDQSVLNEGKDSKGVLQTIITDKWEVFDEDLIKINGSTSSSDTEKPKVKEDPFAASLSLPLLHMQNKKDNSPDLISFF
ncbi:putative clathrin assembly protein At1g25240 [Cornus florida]|uniref:putative clathrin assembly protein At1g25240 n=1 Tax=Cornus florida TaxID=4283 RepID=UPI00289C5ABF|nr:putative clathrin assembly protein At1g25240 [Cornus florida]